MRTFIAAPVTEEVMASARDLQQWLRRGGHQLRYVPPENMHFTLKFLGEISEEEATTLGGALDALGGEYAPFSVSLSRVGAFPDLRSPRVVWIGVDYGREELTDLARSVDDVCGEAGITGDRKPFRPHLTLARARDRRPAPIRFPDHLLDGEFGTMTVDRVILMQSHLGPRGAVYAPLRTVILGSGS
jgi:2'-5' RNA ligase